MIEGAVHGHAELTYDWELGHSTIPTADGVIGTRNEQTHLPYWKNRAERTKLPIKIDNATVNTQEKM